MLSVIALTTLILLAPFYIYDRFNTEYPVAKLEFVRLADQQYLAVLRTASA